MDMLVPSSLVRKLTRVACPSLMTVYVTTRTNVLPTSATRNQVASPPSSRVPNLRFRVWFRNVNPMWDASTRHPPVYGKFILFFFAPSFFRSFPPCSSASTPIHIVLTPLSLALMTTLVLKTRATL